MFIAFVIKKEKEFFGGKHRPFIIKSNLFSKEQSIGLHF